MGIEAIISRIEKDATIEAEQIIARAQAKADEILREGEKKAEHQFQMMINAGKRELSQKYAEEMSRTMIEARNKVRKQKESLVSQCFELAAEELTSLRKKPSYPQILKQLIIKGIQSVESDTCMLSVCRDDYPYATQIASEMSSGDIRITVSPEPVSSAGGVIVRSPRGIMVDNTVEARLERYHKDLLIEVADILFEQENG